MFCSSQYATLRLHLNEFLVSVDSCENRCKICFKEVSPVVGHLAPLGVLFLVVTENVTEQTEGIAAVIGAKILHLSLDEDREFVSDALKRLRVKLVQDSKILHGVVLTAPTRFIFSRAIRHRECHLNEVKFDIKTVLLNDVFEFIVRLVIYNHLLQA